VTLLYVIGFSLIGGLGSLVLAAVVLLVPPERLERLVPWLVSFSVGTLLGAAFLGMLPHAVEHLPGERVLQVFLGGVVVFFVLEKLLVWRHCHKHGECDFHASAGPLVIVGDSVHNFVDGVVIAGAFLQSVPLGIAAALSAVAHEIPQELGEFLVLIHGGYSRKKALILNALSSLTTVVGALGGYYVFSSFEGLGPYLLAFAAAGFAYVALADLIPSRRGKLSLGASLGEFALVLLGIGAILLVVHGH
jgi:zinc and cadmium transporter